LTRSVKSELPPDLLSRPAEEAARLVALAQLRGAEEQAARLMSAEDRAGSEALHDFRVAVRRLRSLLRAHRSLLDGGGGDRTLERLRRIARATNSGRDAEVQAGWVRERLLPTLSKPAQRRAAGWLAAWLDERRDEAYGGSITRSLERFGRLAPKLRRDLATYRLSLEPGPAVPPARAYGAFVAAALREDGRRLRRRLAAASESIDEQRAHRARLAAKRLRYDLEPVAELVAANGDGLRLLKELQEVLGELNDANVFLTAVSEGFLVAAEEKARAAVAAASVEGSEARAVRRRHPASGLLGIVDAARERQRAAANAFISWRDGERTARLWHDLERIAAACDDSHPRP
jgi:CHAD domain-containing protein